MNLDLDDQLVALAVRCSGKRTRSEAIEDALRQMIAIKQQEAIRSLRAPGGKVIWRRCGRASTFPRNDGCHRLDHLDRFFPRRFERARQILILTAPLTIIDDIVALQAARHYRTLRSLGITVRKTIDTLIATRCIVDDIPLLYADRDVDPFVAHLGLRSAMG